MTYSIVARDPTTGDLGVAVQSHYFGTGSLVTWAEPGVGALATQSIGEATYGPLGLDLLRQGYTAPAALNMLMASDPLVNWRQAALVCSNGTVAAHTGDACVGCAGHLVGEQVSTQANMMARDTVWPAMMAAYNQAERAPLAERLLQALEAAETEGGDARGQQSAALLVVSGERSQRPWQANLVDIRVDDATQPLVELRRLLAVNQAAQLQNSVFDDGLLTRAGTQIDEPTLQDALKRLQQAQTTLGDNKEPTFWAAMLLSKVGRNEEAAQYIREACSTHAGWRNFLANVTDAGMLPPENLNQLRELL